MILLKANDSIKKVFHKMIHTIGENVKWTEIFVINNNDIILAGKGKSMFFNFDSRLCRSNIVDLPIDESKVEQMTYDPLLESALNMILYVFGKWGRIKGLKVETQYDQLNEKINNILSEIEVEANLTPENFRFFQGGIQITYEEVIQSILFNSMPQVETVEQEDENVRKEAIEKSGQKSNERKIGLWHNIRWASKKFKFKEEELTKIEKLKARIGHNFYKVPYKCPICEEKLSMVVYPEGKEFRIETNEEPIYLARAYTCNGCNYFFTPKPHEMLTEGDVYYLHFEDDHTAYEDYLELLGRKGERTSNYNFNEFESDYLQKKKGRLILPNLEELNQDIDTKTDEEIIYIKEKMDLGFYPMKIVEKYYDLIDYELRRRKNPKTSQNKENSIYEDRESNEVIEGMDNNEEGENTEKIRSRERNEKKESIGNKVGDKAVNAEEMQGIAGGIDNDDRKKTLSTQEKDGLQAHKKTEGHKGAPNSKIDEDDDRTKAAVENGDTKGMEHQDLSEESSESERTDSTTKHSHKIKEHSDKKVNAEQGFTDKLKSSRDGIESVQEALSDTDKPEIGIQAELKKIVETLSQGGIAFLSGVVEELNLLQMEDLKSLIQADKGMDDLTKQKHISIIEDQIYQVKRHNLLQKAQAYKEKSYVEIQRFIDETKLEDLKSDDKIPLLESLENMLQLKAEIELKNLALNIPENLSKAQYEKYKERIEQYKAVDRSYFRKYLDDKRDASEKREITAFIKRSNALDRSSWLNLLNKLKDMGYSDKIVKPFLEKIREKVMELDLKTLNEICPDPADLSFAEGLQVYEEISSSDFLPELKIDYLGRIEKRLKKLKMDECEQLVRKLEKEMGRLENDNSRIHFYDVRKMQKEEDDTESIIINNALNTYGAAIEDYEYPVLICDASHSEDGTAGFLLTEDHIYYSGLLSPGSIEVKNIEALTLGTGVFQKGIYVNPEEGKKVKISNLLNLSNAPAFLKVLNTFIDYLKEKPESREVSYLSKERHAIKCCIRCGYRYKEGDICPRCGEKSNK